MRATGYGLNMFQGVSAFRFYFLVQTHSDKNCHNQTFWKCLLLPLFPRLFVHTYTKHMHTRTEAISVIFVTLFRKSWKLFASLGILCLPPAPHSTAERCRSSSVCFYRMHRRKRAAPSQRYWRKASYGPAFEKRLLYSYYKMLSIVILIYLKIFRNVSFKVVAWGRILPTPQMRTWGKKQRVFVFF